MVARTTLHGLLERRDLVRMSLIPATSITARTGPPAITPVPGAAGFISTLPAPNLPTISCGMVVPFSGILMRFFFASSMPLRIASGTSPDLPRPKPMVPVSVADYNECSKLHDTAALNGLRYTIDRNDLFGQFQAVRINFCQSNPSLEFQSALTSTFCQFLHSAVIEVTASCRKRLL